MSYLFALILFVSAFFAAFLPTFLGNIVLEDSIRFLRYWGLNLKRKENKKMLHACKPIGYILGPYGIGRTQLGLLIADDIMRNMVSLVLLDSL